MKFRLLLPYFAITFGLAWGLIVLLMMFPVQIEALFGKLSAKNPLFILGCLFSRHSGLYSGDSPCRAAGLTSLPFKAFSMEGALGLVCLSPSYYSHAVLCGRCNKRKSN